MTLIISVQTHYFCVTLVISSWHSSMSHSFLSDNHHFCLNSLFLCDTYHFHVTLIFMSHPFLSATWFPPCDICTWYSMICRCQETRQSFMSLRTATHVISVHFCVTLIISMWHSVTPISKRHMVPVMWLLYKVHPDLYSQGKFKDFHYTLGGPQPKRVRLAPSWAVVTVTWFPSSHKNSKTVTLTQTHSQISKTIVYHYAPEGLGYRFVMSVTQKWWASHRNECEIEMMSVTQKLWVTGFVTWRESCDA